MMCIVFSFAAVVIYNVYETGNGTKPSTVGSVHASTKDEKQRSPTERGQKSGDLEQKPPLLQHYLTNNNLREFVQTKTNKPNHSNSKPKVRHIAFLKVHKAASTTIENILYRFGFRRGLSFAFPKKGNSVSKSTKKLLPLIPPKRNGKYDILCHHGLFNYSIYSSLLPRDTVYIAIVREPWSQFVSAFNYYSIVHHNRYLVQIPENKLENLIRYPEKYEIKPMSFTMNSMARDFGFTENHSYGSNIENVANSTTDYLQRLGSIFDFVLIMEYFDESLIIMKKRLGWSLKDIVYIPKNVHSSEHNISKELMIKFRKRNYLDFLVYYYFLEKFEEEKKAHGETLQVETNNFRAVLVRVRSWCSDEHLGELLIEATTWNDQFVVTRSDCSYMANHDEIKQLNKEEALRYSRDEYKDDVV